MKEVPPYINAFNNPEVNVYVMPGGRTWIIKKHTAGWKLSLKDKGDKWETGSGFFTTAENAAKEACRAEENEAP